MLERKNTKSRILEESLRLFSINGFDAVSIRTIADAVGITNSALYKHFASKQALFDTLVALSKERYLAQCSAAVNVDIRGAEQVEKICLDMFHYQTSDPWITMFRKLLIVEQFKNPQMAAIYKEFFIDIPLARQQEIFRTLIEKGLMQNKNPEVMAMELYAPFFMYHMVRRDEDELVMLFQEHARYFVDTYVLKEKKNDAAQ